MKEATMSKHHVLRRILACALTAAIPTTLVLQSAGCLCGVDKHDKLTATYLTCDEEWANIEAQYQRRMDLIPNLVKVVKASAAHEKDTLEAVMKARAEASKVTLDAKSLSDPEAMAKFQAAQGEVSQALGKLMMVSEAYPDLKANEQFATLMEQIEGTENRILVARKKYNAAVKDYNFEVMNSGGKVFNAITGEMFTARVMFTAQAGANQAPEVDL
jgi:LemA protein